MAKWIKSKNKCCYCGSKEHYYIVTAPMAMGGCQEEDHKCRTCKATWYSGPNS
jgi:hypothetical protein